MESRTVQVDTEVLFDVNALLAVGEFDEEYQEGEALFVYRVCFVEGYEIDVRVVNDDPPYVEVALFLDDVEILRSERTFPESLESGEYVLCHMEKEFQVLFE